VAAAPSPPISEGNTAVTGTPINGGAFTVPDALSNRVIHPFGDFLLHDIGTPDGKSIEPPTPEFAGMQRQEDKPRL